MAIIKTILLCHVNSVSGLLLVMGVGIKIMLFNNMIFFMLKGFFLLNSNGLVSDKSFCVFKNKKENIHSTMTLQNILITIFWVLEQFVDQFVYQYIRPN